MKQYRVRSGQNIYDVALTLYGSVEGLFDLLASNDNLTMETKLSYGMVLNYHEEFIINRHIVSWLEQNKVIVRNGEHYCEHLEVEELIKSHIEFFHKPLFSSITSMSPDEQNMFWETLYMPKLLIQQQGQLAAIKFKLRTDKHLIIDWGDTSTPQIFDLAKDELVEHCYKGNGTHKITFYGDFEFELLDLSEVNGLHYPLDYIYADTFKTNVKVADLNKLIITQ